MLIVALTGGLGAGKTTAARYFAERGAHVIDLDAVAKRVVDENVALRRDLARAFGPAVLDAAGAIDRAELARMAFGAGREGVTRLNALVHPAVGSALEAELDALRRSTDPPPVVIVEVPLLAEAPHIVALVDRVLALEAPEDVRVERSVERGMSNGDALARVAAQATDAQRARLAHDVIVNDGSESDFGCALAAYWELLEQLRQR